MESCAECKFFRAGGTALFSVLRIASPPAAASFDPAPREQTFGLCHHDPFEVQKLSTSFCSRWKPLEGYKIVTRSITGIVSKSAALTLETARALLAHRQSNPEYTREAWIETMDGKRVEESE